MKIELIKCGICNTVFKSTNILDTDTFAVDGLIFKINDLKICGHCGYCKAYVCINENNEVVFVK